MEIKYQLEPRDLEWLTVFVHRGTPTALFLRALPWVGVLVAVGIGVTLFDPLRPMATVFPTSLFLGLMVFFWRRRHRTLRKRGGALFAPCSLATSPEGITSNAPGRSGATAWSALQGYGETPRHFFLMLDGVMAFVVPKRDMSAEQVAQFGSELATFSRALPKPANSGLWGAFRLVLLALLLLLVMFLAWRVGQAQRMKQPAGPQADEAEEAPS